MSTGQERALTTDGAAYFGYATDNAGWSSSERAILLWSHDSKKIATQQQDERNVGEMYLVNTSVGHPTLRVSKFPLPGDPAMAMLHRVVIDVDSGRITRLQMTPDFHRATLGDDLSMNDYNWRPDGSRLALASVSLTPDDGTHTAQLSPSGRHLIDSYSRPDLPPVVAIRDAESGALVLPLEKADISKLLATGWKPPMPIKMTAHDGKTDIYGLLFRPTNFDPSRKYPIVNNVYPGPQTGSTGSRAFSAARGDRQALAQLGFIVVTIDGMGTPGRSKSFQDAYYGAMGRDNTIPDQIAGMSELARRYPWIDLDKAGIWGHSGGGFATTTALTWR